MVISLSYDTELSYIESLFRRHALIRYAIICDLLINGNVEFP